MPTNIRLGNYFADYINNTYGSSITEHLINNRDCASSYSADLFTILSRSHSDFHLKVFDTIHILTHEPSLCKQRECFFCVLIWLQFNISLSAIFFLTLKSLFLLFFFYRCPSLTVTRWDRYRLVIPFYFSRLRNLIFL